MLQNLERFIWEAEVNLRQKVFQKITGAQDK